LRSRCRGGRGKTHLQVQYRKRFGCWEARKKGGVKKKKQLRIRFVRLEPITKELTREKKTRSSQGQRTRRREGQFSYTKMPISRKKGRIKYERGTWRWGRGLIDQKDGICGLGGRRGPTGFLE